MGPRRAALVPAVAGRDDDGHHHYASLAKLASFHPRAGSGGSGERGILGIFRLACGNSRAWPYGILLRRSSMGRIRIHSNDESCVHAGLVACRASELGDFRVSREFYSFDHSDIRK